MCVLGIHALVTGSDRALSPRPSQAYVKKQQLIGYQAKDSDFSWTFGSLLYIETGDEEIKHKAGIFFFCFRPSV